MRLRKFAYSMLILSTTSMSSFAATTAEDAAKLKAALQPYFGTAIDSFIVEPAGDAFNVKLNMSSVMSSISKDIGTYTLSPIAFTLAPLGDGKWKVDFNSDLKITAAVPNQLNLTESIEDIQLTGTFDEALGYFSSFDAKSGAIEFSEDIIETDKNVVTISGKIDSFSEIVTSKANAAGGIDLVGNGSIAPMAFKIKTAGNADMPVDINFGDTTYNITATGLKMRELLEVWKFVLANMKAEKIENQAAVKALLTAALPLFGNLTESLTINKVAVKTPMGAGGADKISFNLGLNGIVKDGMFQEGFAIEGLTLPEAVVPPFAVGLVPKNTSLDFKISGFDIAAATNVFLAAADFNNTPPVPEGFENSLLPLLLPTGMLDIAIQNTGLSNDTYAFTFDGKGSTNFASPPKATAKVTGKGLDELMKLVIAAPPEAGLQSGAGIITVFKGLGKMGTDNVMTWDIDATPDGKLLVNGNDLGAMFAQPILPPQDAPAPETPPAP